MADTASAFAEDVAESGGTVEIADLPCVRGNAVLLHQLFQNLVGNAVKYRRPEVPPHIEVLCEMDAGEGQCRVSVTDNGIGFDPAAADRLFEPFERLVPRSHFRGSGLGMSTAKKIVELHGGTIGASGQLGVGASFTVTLPLGVDFRVAPASIGAR